MAPSLSHPKPNVVALSLLERWTKNFSRLYARRMLELAAASAATATIKTQLQEKIDKPMGWINWEKRDWTDDMMESMGTSKWKRVMMVLSRVINLSILAAPMVLLAPFSYVSETAHKELWRYALYAIEEAGPTCIKFVQWATTRQDLFSQEFCTHFGQLRDKTRGHAWEATERLLERELGKDWKSLIDMETEPIGSGCIAQVYKGKLMDATPTFAKGTELAIKVQHPGIMHKVCVDFYILGKLANLLEGIPYLNLDYLSIRDTVDQFCNVMLPQLDLRLESHHLTRFGRDFENDPQVRFPKPIPELTTPEVLTETFCEGKPILSYQSADLATRKELADLGLKTTLKMIFLNDFIHGDLHPGNILVSRNDRGQLVMTLLDCGLVIEFGPKQHEIVVLILGAFTKERTTCSTAHDRHNLQMPSQCMGCGNVYQGIEQIIVNDAEQNFVEHIGDYIADICYLACRHKVKLRLPFECCSGGGNHGRHCFIAVP
ncbi:ABC1 family-like protein [Fragilaria crotonensis]|nr:ABC1 family-like protein [Fragilaria crotonensis]